MVVVGEAEEEEVVGVVLDELLRDAGRVLVARAGPGEGRLARHRARAEELAVEELVRAVDRVAEAGRDGAALQQALERDLVAPAAAVDQERRAGGAHPGVAQRLEEGLHLVREVGHVHVVDDVVGGAEEPERAGRLERRAVLDVALLDPVVPVHARDPVAIGRGAGRDLRRADRRHGREGRDAVLDQVPALDQRAEVGRVAGLDGLEELVGAKGVDEDEAELLGLGWSPERSEARVLFGRALAAREREVDDREERDDADVGGRPEKRDPASASAATAMMKATPPAPPSPARCAATEATSRSVK